VIDPEGTLVAAVAIEMDITVRRLAEQEVKAQPGRR
jgi:hypothetical protein